ncbi:MAG: hypothetical protein IID14_01380 [Candidatus Marinimicrobia bacterium]|nr:hypothetical protein [Candidatus Neomarinimicrobiota bacterium]
MRTVILMTAASDSNVAGHQFFGKLLSGASRKPHVYRSFLKRGGAIDQGKRHTYQFDRDRFDACIDHLARAMFFNAFRRRWELPILVVSPNFFGGIANDQLIPHRTTQETVQVSRRFLDPMPIKGENPDVFKYRIRYDEANEAYAFAAIFYDSFEIYSFSSRN